MTRIGLSITGAAPAAAIHDVLARCERLGLDEIWVSESFFGGGPIATASIALARTGLTVGFSVLSTAVRQPATLAMEIATLASLYPGRVHLGLGLGMEVYLRRMGIDDAAAKANLPMVVESLRRLFNGEEVRFGLGQETVKLDHVPVQKPMISLAGMGRRGLSQAAKLGDGVVLSWLASPAYIGWARQVIATAVEPAARWVGANAMFTVDTDRRRAHEAARAVLARSLARIPLAMIEPLGIPPLIAAYRGNPNGVPLDLVRDEWVEQMTVAGNEQDCRAAMGRLCAAGLDSLILCPIPGERILPMLDGLSVETLQAARAAART